MHLAFYSGRGLPQPPVKTCFIITDQAALHKNLQKHKQGASAEQPRSLFQPGLACFGCTSRQKKAPRAPADTGLESEAVLAAIYIVRVLNKHTTK